MSDKIASLLDLPEFEPEHRTVRLPRLGLELELQELPYDKLMKIRRETDPMLHLILASVVNHPEMKREEWYHDKMGCATPVDALKKLLRVGEIEKIARESDRLNGYGMGSVLTVQADDETMENAATEAALEELEKN